MSEQIAYLLLMLTSAGIGALGMRVWTYIQDLKRRVSEQEEQLERRRHTYPTTHMLEDALSIVTEDILRYQADAEYRNARMRQLAEILQIGREGPHAYDSERPNKRPRGPE